MHSYDWWFLAGMACLIVAGLAILASVIRDQGRYIAETKAGERANRSEYQRRIRWCIEEMAECLHADDLEWTLHSLLYEYRHGTPALQGGAALFAYQVPS